MSENLTEQLAVVTEKLRQCKFEESEVAISALAGLVSSARDDYERRIVFNTGDNYLELSSYRFRSKDNLLETFYAGMLVRGSRLVLDEAFPGTGGSSGTINRNVYFGDGQFVVRALPLAFAFQHQADLSVVTLSEAKSIRQELAESETANK